MSQVIDVIALGLDFIASKEGAEKPITDLEVNFVMQAKRIVTAEEAGDTVTLEKSLEVAKTQMAEIVATNKGDRTKLFKAFKKGVESLG